MEQNFILSKGVYLFFQSYVRCRNFCDYLSLEGKSLTGLIMAGSMGNTSMIWKQAAIGTLDPWLSVNYSNNRLVLNGVHNQGIRKTSTLSIMGAFGPLYKQVPLFNSGGLNFLIEQGLIAPLQKTVTNVQD